MSNRYTVSVSTIHLSDLSDFAATLLGRVAPKEKGAFCIFLQGELGAGKTTFMQTFAQKLGVTETVQSPTYVLMRSYDISYKTFTKLIHVDAYRLDQPVQLSALQPETFLNDLRVIVCIEWPERIQEFLPSPDLRLHFSHTKETNARDITIEVE